jgi:hypothetical protein
VATSMSMALYSLYVRAMRFLPPSAAEQMTYLLRFGSLPNLTNPKMFNEKVVYRKLHGDFDKYARLSDKVEVKQYVSTLLGNSVVIPNIWVGSKLPARDDRDWAAPFVIKSSNGSGENIFVESQSNVDWGRIEITVADWLSRPRRGYPNEPWYALISPRLLVEPKIGDNPVDYKFFVFDGIVKAVQVHTDRYSEHKCCFYDSEWRKLPYWLKKYPQELRDLPRPKHFEEMLRICEVLGRGTDFVRVDLYDTDQGPLFGELTFAPGSGHSPIVPRHFEKQLGEYWKWGGKL